MAFAVLVLVGIHAGLIEYGAEKTTQTSAAQDPALSATPSSLSDVTALGDQPASSIVSDIRFGPDLTMTGSVHVVFAHPVSTVTLTVPARTAALAGGAFSPKIRNLRVVTDSGRAVKVVRSLQAGTSIKVKLPKRSRTLDVTYSALHSVVRSRPSSDERGLALGTPLTLGPTTGFATVLHVDGAITNIGCVEPDGLSKPCGYQNAKGWSVPQGPNDQGVAVVAQLDLRTHHRTRK